MPSSGQRYLPIVSDFTRPTVGVVEEKPTSHCGVIAKDHCQRCVASADAPAALGMRARYAGFRFGRNRA
jgi:hypothetical protein